MTTPILTPESLADLERQFSADTVSVLCYGEVFMRRNPHSMAEYPPVKLTHVYAAMNELLAAYLAVTEDRQPAYAMPVRQSA